MVISIVEGRLKVIGTFGLGVYNESKWKGKYMCIERYNLMLSERLSRLHIMSVRYCYDVSMGV